MNKDKYDKNFDEKKRLHNRLRNSNTQVSFITYFSGWLENIEF